MYWPYLRSKQNEVLAIRELAPLLAQHNLVVPIFKPVSATASLQPRLLAIAASGGRFALIVNSDEGKPVPSSAAVRTLLTAVQTRHPPNAMPAYEIRPTSTPGDLTAFAAQYAVSRCCIVHRNHAMAAATINSALGGLRFPPVHVFLDGGTPTAVMGGVNGVGRVLLHDGFRRCRTNGQYPPVSNFGDLLYVYGSRGAHGFGDFGPLGDIYITGGASPSHVALHLTEASPTGPTLVCHHFVSTSPTAAHVRTKYLNAVAQLCRHTGSPPAAVFSTAGVLDYHASHQAGRFPGLGHPKRWSLKHHIELVQRHLAGAGVKPFI